MLSSSSNVFDDTKGKDNEDNLLSAESAREVKIIGAFAPLIIAATSAPAKKINDLYKALPASLVGTINISASPATSDRIFLCFAAWEDTALSNANGPSTRHPLI